MKLTSSSFGDNQPIPGEYAFCVSDPENHVTFRANLNPSLAWNDLPSGTKSLVAERAWPKRVESRGRLHDR